MKNKKVKKMIDSITGNNVTWVGGIDSKSNLVNTFEHNNKTYLHSYHEMGVVSLTADQLRGVK